MSIISGLYDVLQAQATLDQTRATAQDTQALAAQRMQTQQLLNLQIQQHINTQNAMQSVAPGFNTFDPSLAPDPNDDSAEAMRKEAARQRKDATQARQMANAIAARGGDEKAVDQWSHRANDMSWRATQASREALTEAKNINQQVANLAASVKDTDSLNAFMQSLPSVSPKIATNIATQLDRDPYTGGFAYTPKTQTIVNAMRDQGVAAAKQQELTLKAAADLEKQKDNERKDAESKARIAELDSAAARNRAAADKTKAEIAGTMPAKPAVVKPIGPAKPATPDERLSARDAIMAEEDFKDQKFDASMNAFSTDVANRAKQIVRQNPDTSLDEAQQQAINELKPFVANKKNTTYTFGIPTGSEQIKTYTKGGAGLKAKAEVSAGQGSQDIQEGRDGKKYQYIGGPKGNRQDKANWKLVGG